MPPWEADERQHSLVVAGGDAPMILEVDEVLERWPHSTG